MPSPSSKGRGLLLHYHFFKNAGTSVDHILIQNFGPAWRNYEFPIDPAMDHGPELVRLIRQHPDLMAISSHSLKMPMPVVDGVDILPIVFLRHPLDRLRSAYLYQRATDRDRPMPRLARKLSFPDYLRTRLSNPDDRGVRNFQAHRLAMAVPTTTGSERERAFAALDLLPFMGIVENFDASIQQFEVLARRMFPKFRVFAVRANVGQAMETSLVERLDALRCTLGETGFTACIEANRLDLELHAHIARRYVIPTA